MTTPLEERYAQILRVAASPEGHSWRGVTPDPAALDAWAVGRLMPHAELARRTLPVTSNGDADDALRKFFVHAFKVAPRYDFDSARAMLRETLDHLQARVEQGQQLEDLLLRAVGIAESVPVPRRTELTPDLQAIAKHCIAAGPLTESIVVLCAMCSIPVWPEGGNENAAQAAASIAVREAELRALYRIAGADATRAIGVARALRVWEFVDEAEPSGHQGALLLAGTPELVEVCRPWIERALVRVEAIAQGAVPFAADKALPLEDAHALSRLVRIALENAEPWLGPMIEPLLLGMCVAPSPTVKSAPSQAAAIGIAKAIALRPNPAAFDALALAKTKTRHAGLAKKLARMHTVARRRLADAPDSILQWPRAAIPKRQLAAAVLSFERLLLHERAIPAPRFEACVLDHPTLATIAQRLVWSIRPAGCERLSAVPGAGVGSARWIDAHGRGLAFDTQGAMVELWHPLAAADDAEAHAWRHCVIEQRWPQPFNQVFRETYVLDEETLANDRLDTFEGYDADIATLLALAAKSGWLLDRERRLSMSLGEWSFVFDCGELHPGKDGVLRTGPVRALRDGKPAALRELGAVPLSELLRTVDLMVSVATFRLADPEAWELDKRYEHDVPLQRSRRLRAGLQGAERRREVLARIFGTQASGAGPWVDGRYVRIGDVSIAIATGQARRMGEALDLAPSDAAVVLPYPDEVMGRIVGLVNRLASTDRC
jgi:hypothetical protein